MRIVKRSKPNLQTVRDIGSVERMKTKAFRAKNPVAADLADVVPYKIYDTLTTAANTAASGMYQFFTTPQSATKGKLLTNLEQAGRLPDPRHFFVRSLRFIFGASMLLTDILAMLNNYYAEFWIGNKIYMEGPLYLFPGGAGVNGVTTNTSESVYSLGMPDCTTVDDFGDKGFSILQGQTFKVNVIMGGTTPTFSNTTTPASAGLRLICVLDGILAREVQ
jgi:hypothetical protein